MKYIAMAAGLALSAPSLAQSPLGQHAPVAGARSQVMTLASTHLSEHKEWTAHMLEPLLAKLASFRPTIITHEGVSGEQCEAMRAFPDLYADAYEQYCWDPSLIRQKTRLAVPEALRTVRETLDAWPDNPSPAERRRLAMLFLAAGDRTSAKVQWLRLEPVERVAKDGLDDSMVEILERKGKALNESYDVAAILAARLGLERVYGVDDHTSDGALAHEGKDFEDAMSAHFTAARASPLLAAHKARESRIKDGAEMLSYYREMNAPGAQNAQIRGDFGEAMAQQSPGTPARRYVGWWDVRNLRMAANVRSVFAAKPGARVLNIVGASHKPWYDALMGMMADVEVVDASAVLR
ncbi:hypothetical protein G7076_07340 [Sphingomonas sp. HDW15A]|uniref:DUF5694 domain-containing protein n=1 Tax=Sphingomonas sp. HDW15A TaxID=2714942 RepID=UPI00140DB814|nr:DUF5694 domain-containing protein [Sphingomonas sp. HDW15A]QIK96284.1 hypothetical protein G7076_07340 [Sphingomonas sp. HDW15A]